jgi:hypothetical protein
METHASAVEEDRWDGLLFTDPHSGHYIHQEHPRRVTASIRKVIEAARKKACALGSKNHGQCIKAQNHPRR